MKNFFLIFLSFALILFSCFLKKTTEPSRRSNEFFYRSYSLKRFSISTPTVNEKPKYPWKKTFHDIIEITKHSFKCPGSLGNPPKNYLQDCNGSEDHSLPIVDGSEFVYPVFIEMLNFLQKKLVKKITITCGHICKNHLKYMENNFYPEYSMHLDCTKVDFFISQENNFPKVVNAMNEFYLQHGVYKKFGKLSFNDDKTFCSNKEIQVRLMEKSSGNNFLFISMELKFDRNLNTHVRRKYFKYHIY